MSAPSVEASIRFAKDPSARAWYEAHNVTIVTAYLDHRGLAEEEDRVMQVPRFRTPHAAVQSNAQHCQRNHGNAVGPAVGVGPGVDDDSIDQAVADSFV